MKNFQKVRRKDDKRNKYIIDFSIKNKDDYLKANVIASADWTSDVANINTSASTTPTDVELETIENNFFTEFFYEPTTKSESVSFFSPLFISRHSLIYVLKRIIN